MTTEIEKCPFETCGNRCSASKTGRVFCVDCDYCTPQYPTEAEAIAAHNKLARAARLLPRAVELLEGYERARNKHHDQYEVTFPNGVDQVGKDLAKFLREARDGEGGK